jgi:hypothetical protein
MIYLTDHYNGCDEKNLGAEKIDPILRKGCRRSRKERR